MIIASVSEWAINLGNGFRWGLPFAIVVLVYMICCLIFCRFPVSKWPDRTNEQLRLAREENEAKEAREKISCREWDRERKLSLKLERAEKWKVERERERRLAAGRKRAQNLREQHLDKDE